MSIFIDRIKNRIADPLLAIDWALRVLPTPTPAPPTTHAEVDAAEKALGFSFPPLVRALYTEVGDGGWGPGWGLLPLAGEGSVVEETLWCHSYSPTRPGEPGWPTGLIQFVNWGCHYASCVDCLHPDCPVIFYDNDVANQNGVGPGDYLYPEASSLADWLSAWLDGVDLWENGPKARRLL